MTLPPTPTLTVDAQPKSPLLGSSEKEIRQMKKEERKAEKLRLKEEKKRAKDEKKAEKLRLKEEKKQAGASGGGRARRGTIATASPSRDHTRHDVELSSPASPRGVAAVVSDVGTVPAGRAAEWAKEMPTKQGSSSSSSVPVSSKQTPAKAESGGEVEAKGSNDKNAEAASKKAEEKSESEESAPRGGASNGGEYYPYEELKKMKDKLDRTKLEVTNHICQSVVVC
jgi:hypothetical protein